jgi:hypothetical protein
MVGTTGLEPTTATLTKPLEVAFKAPAVSKTYQSGDMSVVALRSTDPDQHC